MYDIGGALGRMLFIMAILLIIAIPLGVWKLIDLGIWLFKHLAITLK